jgi:hypothetical protein
VVLERNLEGAMDIRTTSNEDIKKQGNKKIRIIVMIIVELRKKQSRFIEHILKNS